ncbi:sn-glycerol-3-phosphate ABC transporter ATP-binding protein UgpC [Aerophototrophica crusticola]|uniref:Sn-glycerol-3-phosphate ABC transporter ATP-binding protein UgpC n=1 Tax=Aerophototrophica crusticola TaxID=1709002 RepID=A0A858R3S1_9PROT|nr:sn-glycerol-3-phosphate ABC transporter ATP-binding protein UgpC [Rhodospirillaceae bacterium B3]
MAQIIFDNIAKRFGDVSVIENLNLHIRDQEFMVFVGPSGCGKSTALRMIAGLEDISAGSLSIGDRVVNDVHPKDRDVAMVFQSYALYPHMSVRENIAFGLKIRKLPTAEIDGLVSKAASMLGLTEYLDRKPRALSGGQRQRVALGRAIVRNPKVFLFDEPLSNLDAELRVTMRAEISKLQRRLKITTVYVTHDQVEAMTMGDRIAVLAPLKRHPQGNLMQVGTPLELYDRPQNLFVARFIGTPSMNIATMQVEGGGTHLRYHELVLPVPDRFRAAASAYQGKALAVGFRPEHVGHAEEHQWERTAPIGGPVEIVETLGHEAVIHFRLGEEILIGKVRGHGMALPRPGEGVELVVKADDLHLFDPQTEQRLPEA